MKTIKGPAIFLAQFAGDAAPLTTCRHCRLGAGLGYKGVQIPTWDGRLFDLKLAAESKTYCDEVKGTLAKHGCSSPSFPRICRASWSRCIPPTMRCSTASRRPRSAATDSAPAMGGRTIAACGQGIANLGLTAHATFSGALAWPYHLSLAAAPAGLVETAFDELARRWLPILNAFDEAGVDVCYEIHPGEDLHDGVTFEMFLERVNNHPRAATCCMIPAISCCSSSTILQFIDIYHERIKMFHVKDAEFNPTGRQGVYRGYQPWMDAPGASARWATARWISAASSPSSTQYGFDGWAVLEWECCIKERRAGRAPKAPIHRGSHHPG